MRMRCSSLMCWYDDISLLCARLCIADQLCLIRDVLGVFCFGLHDSKDTLTAHPLSEDTVIFAVAMCAPWTTLQSFKYKVRTHAA